MPDYIYSDKRLTDVSRRVYCFIYSYKNPFYFSDEHLAEMFKCHPDTIKTAIGQLKELGLITTDHKVKAGGGKIRMCLQTPSEGASTPLRPKKSEATKGSLHPYNDSKDNNIKEKNFVEEKDFKDKAWLDARKLRKEKKLNNGFRTGSRSFGGNVPAKSPTPLFTKREGVADGRHIR